MSKFGPFFCLTAALVTLPVPAAAQRRGEVVLFSSTNFQGPAFTVSGTRESLGIPWPVRSVRVFPGEAWDLCTLSRFRSPCTRVAQDTSSTTLLVKSARPSIAQTLPQPVPPSPRPPGTPSSLRGMSAEFFPAPSDARGRLASCPDGAAACAQDSADRFCRQLGWNGAAFVRQQTVSGINFLTDVLCTMSGR